MTELQIYIETSYILGINSQKLENALDKRGLESLIDEYTQFVENIVNAFNEWQKDKDDSTLQLLHDFLDEEIVKDFDNAIAKYWE